jgi:hypothetical protein
MTADPTPGREPECTGLTARWCPIHGDCVCPEGWDGDMDEPDCPLHASASQHAEPGREPVDPAELVTPEMVERANAAWIAHYPRYTRRDYREAWCAALTSVAGDLYARGLAAGRRECTAELRAALAESPSWARVEAERLAAEWAGQEEGTWRSPRSEQ